MRSLGACRAKEAWNKYTPFSLRQNTDASLESNFRFLVRGPIPYTYRNTRPWSSGRGWFIVEGGATDATLPFSYRALEKQIDTTALTCTRPTC